MDLLVCIQIGFKSLLCDNVFLSPTSTGGKDTLWLVHFFLGWGEYFENSDDVCCVYSTADR